MPVSNPTSPNAVTPTDPVTGAQGVEVVADYTQITTAGTTVVKATPGVFLGLVAISTGTGMTVVVYDGTASSTNVVLGTATVGALGGINTVGPGIRCRTGITVVTGGTMGQVNCLWD